jgi:hypothetical protein
MKLWSLINSEMGDNFMNLRLVITISILTALVGCGKNKNSNGPRPEVVQNQGTCSDGTLDLYNDIYQESSNRITDRTRVREINQSCESLQGTLGNGYCQDSVNRRHNNRDIKNLSYADVSNYCDEVKTYLAQRNLPPTPVPIPRVPPARPNYRNIFVEDMDPGFGVYFEKSNLTERDMDKRKALVRCQISIPERSSVNLLNVRGNLVSTTIKTSSLGSTYYIVASLLGSRDLIRITCRTRNASLSVYDVNQVLDGVAEFRKSR